MNPGEDRPGRGGYWLLTVLMLANILNFFDRNAPAIVVGPIQTEFGLNDLQVGVVSSAFTVIFAIVSVPLGRLGDRTRRVRILGIGMVVWSALTAATGFTTGFVSLLLVRLGIGVGEATAAPVANSLIADRFPAERRARATSIYMLGLPIGTVLAFFTIGSITDAFGTWRATFFIAAVPGVVLALIVFLLREPARGAAEEPVAGRVGTPAADVPDRPLRRLLRVPTLWWLSVAGLGYNLASYSVGTFMVPFLQRYFGESLTTSAVITGFIFGVPGLFGLTVGGLIADRARRRSPRHRTLVGAVLAAASVPLVLAAMLTGPGGVLTFAVLFGIGWLLAYTFFICAYPALADVVEPRLRATAFGVMYALTYLLGGALGPLLVGALSDSLAAQAQGVSAATAAGEGLHGALFVLPISLAITALAMFAAARTVGADSRRMSAALAEPAPVA